MIAALIFFWRKYFYIARATVIIVSASEVPTMYKFGRDVRGLTGTKFSPREVATLRASPWDVTVFKRWRRVSDHVYIIQRFNIQYEFGGIFFKGAQPRSTAFFLGSYKSVLSTRLDSWYRPFRFSERSMARRKITTWGEETKQLCWVKAETSEGYAPVLLPTLRTPPQNRIAFRRDIQSRHV